MPSGINDPTDLSLLRHGDALPAEPGATDFQRHLSTRGTRNKPPAQQCVQQQLSADWIYASTAVRAQASAAPFAKAWTCPKIDLAELYLADLAQLYDSLKQTPADIQHVLLVGHNPGLSYMTHSLDAQQPPSELPTAGLVSFVITKEWVDLTPGCAERVLTLIPT